MKRKYENKAPGIEVAVYGANGLASVTAQRNPRARKQFQKAPGKDGAGPRGILFASESKDAGARRSVRRSF